MSSPAWLPPLNAVMAMVSKSGAPWAIWLGDLLATDQIAEGPGHRGPALGNDVGLRPAARPGRQIPEHVVDPLPLGVAAVVDLRPEQPIEEMVAVRSAGGSPLRASTARRPRRAATADTARQQFDWSVPHVMRVSAFWARASPIRNSSLRTLLPDSSRPVRSSRFTHSSGPSSSGQALELEEGRGRVRQLDPGNGRRRGDGHAPLSQAGPAGGKRSV